MKILLQALLITSFLFTSSAFAQEEALEMLLFEEIPGLIINAEDLSQKNITPASVTTITADDIERTPARDIYDLIETYVPGAIWMTHAESPHPGIRGLIVDRNYNFLCLVNGKLINSRWFNGVETELSHWDLGDIEKIEIIRGPGAVTYGPGAIMGVINITTKKYFNGTQVGGQFDTKYNSKGIKFTHGVTKPNYDFLIYGSIVTTNGLTDPNNFTIDNITGDYGYIGKNFPQGSTYSPPALNHYRDYENNPQIKLHADLKFLNDWRLWIRFTQSGDVGYHGAGFQGITKTQFNNTGDYLNIAGSTSRQFTISLENEHKINDILNIQTDVSFDSFDHTYRRFQGQSQGAQGDTWDTMGRRYSENEYFFKTLVNYLLAEKHHIALGGAISHETWQEGWGNPETFWASEQLHTPESSWSMNTYSVMGEGLISINEFNTLLISGRVDFNKYTDNLYSPRVGWITNLQDAGTLKLIAQQSTRMTVASLLHEGRNSGNKSDPEKLKGVELIYDKTINSNYQFNSSLFYNNVEVIGWDGAALTTTLIGELKLWGLELEGKYTTDTLTIGLNHAFTKQTDYQMAEGKTRTGISYADYNYSPIERILFSDEGNDLNNWSNHATKMYLNYTINENWLFHLNARIFWGWEGMKDGLDMIKKSVADTSYEAAALAVIKEAEDRGYAKADFRLNTSISYKPTSTLKITAYIINLLSTNDNKRYGYSTGFADVFPNRVMWHEEPRTFGVKITCDL